MLWSAEEFVLWSDEAIVVANKAAGLLVIRGGFAAEPFLAQILEARFGRLWVVHRLDRDTSGVVIFARTAAAHRDLNTQFQERDTLKVYHALTVGVPPWTHLQVDLPLQRDGDRRHRTLVDAQGKASMTQLNVLERLGRYALVEAIPRTGRTHQIRAHLSAVGYPIVSDELYGRRVGLRCATVGDDGEDRDGSGTVPIARCALHALRIAFAHPADRRWVEFIAPYPGDFSDALRALRATAAG